MARKKSDSGSPDPIGIANLNKLLEHRLRLTICVLLSRFENVSFSRFKELTGETDGNLGANLRKLEDAGYIKVRKEFVERKPSSSYSLTAKGKKSLRAHVDALERLISQADARKG